MGVECLHSTVHAKRIFHIGQFILVMLLVFCYWARVIHNFLGLPDNFILNAMCCGGRFTALNLVICSSFQLNQSICLCITCSFIRWWNFIVLSLIFLSKLKIPTWCYFLCWVYWGDYQSLACVLIILIILSSSVVLYILYKDELNK